MDVKQRTIDLWDSVAKKFGSFGRGYWNSFGERLVSSSTIKSGSKVLDIGIGRGASLFAAAAIIGETGEVIGIDISSAMVAETQNEIDKKCIKNTKVQVMDADKLEFEAGYFDMVLCGFGFPYLIYGENKLEGVKAVLKEGGQFAISTWGIQKDQEWMHEIFKKYIKPIEQPQATKPLYVLNTAEGVKLAMESCDFKDVEATEETAEVVYATKEEWFEDMSSNAAKLAFDQIRALGDDIFIAYKKDMFAGLERLKTDEGYLFRMPVIYAYGRKK